MATVKKSKPLAAGRLRHPPDEAQLERDLAGVRQEVCNLVCR